jgi:hypothetical protein
VSVWTAVLEEAGVKGGTAVQVASRLGLPLSLVQAVLDHAERLGVVAVAGKGCGSGCPTGPEMPAGCAGCPLSAS